jgi:hypothetical protein
MKKMELALTMQPMARKRLQVAGDDRLALVVAMEWLPIQVHLWNAPALVAAMCQ